MKQSERNYNRIVVKIGSSLLCLEAGGLDKGLFRKIGQQIVALRELGKEVILVSSGAIALGMRIIGLSSRPKELSYLQAAAAIGQNALMDNYSSFFKGYGTNCAQILLTWDDFNDRRRYLNARNTLLTLFKLGSLAIINENDTVSTDEIKFGDNDQLSARVASLICADLLIMLSDVDGLLDKDKKLIKIVDDINPAIKSMAFATQKKTCVGGMITKIEAAKIAVDSGIPCVIANGRSSNIILETVKEPGVFGTLFVPKKGYLDQKQRWIAFGTKPKGRIIIDAGARDALVNKKSLLSVGVVAVEGNFESGDVVSVSSGPLTIARGKVGIGSKQLDKIKGTRYAKEAIHRDNIVILQ
ncbi:MAG: glutamate 5-kinase [Candidatus Omnitrophota bacterium]